MIAPLVIILITYVMGKMALGAIEKSLLFQPVTMKKKTPVVLPSDMMEIMIYNKLHGVFMGRQSDQLVIVAHGNAGNVQGWAHMMHPLGNFGSVLLFDYSGYGKSKGSPSEDQFYKDIRLVWKYATKVLQYPANRIILHGFSIGCSPALWLGQELCVRKKPLPMMIISQSGFSSLKSIAQEHVPSSVSYFISSEFDNVTYIKRMRGKIPILIIHSIEDEIININHAVRLLLARKDASFFRIKGSHNDPQMDEHYVQVINQFIIEHKDSTSE